MAWFKKKISEEKEKIVEIEEDFNSNSAEKSYESNKKTEILEEKEKKEIADEMGEEEKVRDIVLEDKEIIPEELRVYENYKKQLRAVKRYTRIPETVFEELESLNSLLEVDLPISLEDKFANKDKLAPRNERVKVFSAYRVEHNNTLGPYHGGIIIHPMVCLDKLKGLACLMTIKNALYGLPFGGAKGGILANPEKLKKGEVERLARGYVQKLIRFIGKDKDIPSPDIGCNSEVIGVMVNEYSQIFNEKEAKLAFTGKPIREGGINGREEAASFGGFYALQLFLNKFGMREKELKFAIQGFESMGENFSKIVEQTNNKIIAVSDAQGGIASLKGFSSESLIRQKRLRGSLSEPSNKEIIRITNKQLLTMSCDVLVLAAIENQITIENAPKIKAPIILELANGSITKEAYDILIASGKKVIPDVLANAGGVIVSYLEHEQNIQETSLNTEEVLKLLKEKIHYTCELVYKKSQDMHCGLKDAAYLIAVERLAKAIMAK